MLDQCLALSMAKKDNSYSLILKLLSTVNILHNKTMAKSFTITQMKELLDTHENTVINIFTNRTENLESKISNIQDESKVR